MTLGSGTPEQSKAKLQHKQELSKSPGGNVRSKVTKGAKTLKRVQNDALNDAHSITQKRWDHLQCHLHRCDKTLANDTCRAQ